jgi:ABC-2 type transport system permease protein
MLAVPMAYSVLTAVAGLFFNLKFPKYDWTSEFHVVKNSAAVLFSVLTGMFAAVIMLTFAVILAKYAYVYQTVCVIIILGAAWALYAGIREKRLYM